MVEELIKILWHPVEPSMSFFCVFIALLCMETALNECLTICEIRMESFGSIAGDLLGPFTESGFRDDFGGIIGSSW